MHIFTGIFVFGLGLLIGSFLNVVALRYNTGLSIFHGRSKCFSCGRSLIWKDLVPFFSFVFLRGKCRGCGSKISFQYPLVEILTGIIFLGIFLIKLPLVQSFYYAILASVLIVIAIYDLRHTIVPDGLVYFSAGFGIVGQLIFTLISSPDGLQFINYLDIFSGIIFFVPFFLLWYFSDGKWIGLGDGKLALAFGCSLGFARGISAIILGFWIGTVVALALMGIQRFVSSRKNAGSGQVFLFLSEKTLTMKSEIPFAPFLILGWMVAFFFNVDILGLQMFL